MRKHKLQQLVLPQSQVRQLQVLEHEHCQTKVVARGSERVLDDARQQLVQAEFNTRTAQAELARAVGDMTRYQEAPQ